MIAIVLAAWVGSLLGSGAQHQSASATAGWTTGTPAVAEFASMRMQPIEGHPGASGAMEWRHLIRRFAALDGVN